MKNIALTVVAICLSLLACKKSGIAKNTPNCIHKEIAIIKKNENAISPIIKEYIFQNQTVYLIDFGMGHVDGQSKVVDKRCNELGNLGGILGDTKINGEDFLTVAVYVKTIWEK